VPTASMTNTQFDRPAFARPRGFAVPADAFTRRRDAIVAGNAAEPLARVAALLVSISHNNGYEGRDPATIPDTLTSGFVADLLGLDVDDLAELLVDLRVRGLIESGSTSTLRLKDIAGLERLAS
jgi:hypothetical protein